MSSLEHKALLQDQQEGQMLQIHARPKPHLNIAGIDFAHSVKPALYLSGDAVDYFSLPDGRILAYLLDVSGSGTAAALLCMFIKSMVRHSVAMSKDISAASVLGDVNRLLLEAGIDKHATMVCMIVEPEHNKLQWANAGHTPRPFFWSENAAQLQLGGGQIIGLFADANYQNQVINLPKSFSFVVVSDGVLDCLPEASFAKREQQLVELIEQEQGVFSALHARLDLSRQQQMPDDISMLVVSRGLYE